MIILTTITLLLLGMSGWCFFNAYNIDKQPKGFLDLSPLAVIPWVISGMAMIGMVVFMWMGYLIGK